MPEADSRSRVSEAFEREFGRPCSAVARAPGRVNLLGEHVDYNDGWVLPAAIDRATYLAFSRARTDECRVWAADYEQHAVFSAKAIMTGEGHQADVPEWARYPAGVAWSLGREGLAIHGMDAVIASDVPRGAGLSSSASVELAAATAWQSLGGWHIPPIELARLCQRAENEYVGVNCGIMDQLASACGERDRLLVLDCRSLEYRTLPLPKDVVIVVADTGVRHTLSSSAYNDRRAACEEAVRILKRDLPNMKALRDIGLVDFNRLAGKLPPEVQKRARHVVEEMDRTRHAIPLLEAGNMPAFGRLMNECHASLRDLYEVSCLELDVMARIAQSLEGCYGARLTGAGFGGCTANLVAGEQASSFVKELAAGYESETRRHPEIYVCSAADGAGLA